MDLNSRKKNFGKFCGIYYVYKMEILEYIIVALVMGIISYIIWDRKDKRTIKRGDEWD
jgi:hypothetical protein